MFFRDSKRLTAMDVPNEVRIGEEDPPPVAELPPYEFHARGRTLPKLEDEPSNDKTMSRIQRSPLLAEAEEIAGYETWAIRAPEQGLLDFAITGAFPSDEKENEMKQRVKTWTGSKSFFFDSGYGGTTAVLSFREAMLAKSALRILRLSGFFFGVKKTQRQRERKARLPKRARGRGERNGGRERGKEAAREEKMAAREA